MSPAMTSSNPPPRTIPSGGDNLRRIHRLDAIKALVNTTVNIHPRNVILPRPIDSLRRGEWVKLICGASFEDAADIRNLSLVYTLAGVDCIDCAADESVVNAVNDGINAAMNIGSIERPWVMISVNDDKEDLHFRKAEFDPENCPLDCSRPCEKVCPANAILLKKSSTGQHSLGSSDASDRLQGGVVTERCYGCGRCFPVCPFDKIRAKTYIRETAATSELLKRNDVDAIEIHTTGRLRPTTYRVISTRIDFSTLDLLLVSMPDIGNSTFSTMQDMHTIMESRLLGYNLWQLDGRPMSGDIGRGATREAINFAMRLAAIPDKPHGFYQLAGGTNLHTIDCLKKVGLFKAIKFSGTGGIADSAQALIGGIAYGGYARKIVARVLHKLPTQPGCMLIEDYPEYLMEALREALTLVGPVKSYNMPLSCPQCAQVH
ncbi:uncharacterized protein LOC110017905 isoform X2 [Phalaenopsis equestris]|uniref:uncharacterized protein LOC110017905 isoform X2 n=1 Tax=Phalaenopsis equestris TaxID=78828 RepID=UPI0009E234F7|nr:uncharacterized protein LOC110017905 isoform X2 [Phalaenopsis equestris]